MYVPPMRAEPLVVAVCLFVLVACSGSNPVASTPPRAAVQFGDLEVDGQIRRYRVFAPPTVEEGVPAPVVLALHDAFGTAETFREVTQFDRAATAGNFIVVYPESLGGTWNGGFCCGTARAGQQDVDDVGFLTRVLDALSFDYTIDPARVYAVGASNGGIMAYRLGCELANRIAGVAAVGGAMIMDGCSPRQSVSILAIHGTNDGHVPYEGGVTSGAPDPVPSQRELVHAWAGLNGCGEGAHSETGTPLAISTWTNCRAGTSVRLVTVRGGGHTWFSAEFDGPAGAMDATQAITEFFGLTPQ